MLFKQRQDVWLHLVDVWVPHLGEESEGRRGVWVVYRELDPSLSYKNTSLHVALQCIRTKKHCMAHCKSHVTCECIINL